MYIYEAFEINLIQPKFLSLLLTGKFRRRRDRKGSSQKNIRRVRIYSYSTAVNSIILPYVDSECTVHIQNLL